ncbi:unnamed protein product [Cunninghamella echinulata]
MPTILPPSPPSSVGKNPWIKKPSSSSSSTVASPRTATSLTTLSKHDNRIGSFISFLFASWATVMSLQSSSSETEDTLSSNNNNTGLLTPPNSTSSSLSKRKMSQSMNNNKSLTINTSTSTTVATTKTRKLLPTVAHHCIDIMLLASAMFITMIHYLTGDLDDEPKPIQHQYQHSTSYHQQYHRYQYGRKKKIITPPSQNTIMDIKQLREWQRQQQLEEEDQNRYLLLSQLDQYHYQQQQTLTSPMDDHKQQRILAWATQQNYDDDTNNHNDHGNTMYTKALEQPPVIMEEIDDDEKYTFDDNWSVDEPMASHINSQYLHPASMSNPTSSYPSSYASSNQSSNPYRPNNHLHSINKIQKKMQDQKLNMMQNQVQSLIQEGQAALTKKVKVYELDPNEILMRRSLKLQKQQRLQQQQQ